MPASAPGKLLLAGEYAVLDGPPAVVVAVNRRAQAHVTGKPQQLSAFLQAAQDQLANCYGADHPATIAAGTVVVDSHALRNDDGIKLGLGSSAAATVAAITAALAEGNEPIDPDQLHTLAFRAHASAQAPRGSRGSGADIAACVYGGALVVKRELVGDDEPIAARPIELPKQLVIVPVWAGTAADTPSLVAKVRELRDHDREAYDAAIGQIAQAATLLIAACEADDAAAAVAAVARGNDVIAHLGAVAKVALIQPGHIELAGVALRCGGSAKPTGAGAGDISIAAFTNGADAERFRQEISALGMILPALNVDPTGAGVDVPDV